LTKDEGRTREERRERRDERGETREESMSLLAPHSSLLTPGWSFASRLSSLTLPTKLDVDGKEAGDLTSAVVSPRLGPIALAYVRSAHAAPGSVVGVAGTDARAEVVELPFDG